MRSLDSESYPFNPAVSDLLLKKIFLLTNFISIFLDFLQVPCINFAIGCGSAVRIRKRAASGFARTGTGKIFILLVRLLTSFLLQ
jgi:hypothetical protein